MYEEAKVGVRRMVIVAIHNWQCFAEAILQRNLGFALFESVFLIASRVQLTAVHCPHLSSFKL